MKAKAIAIAAVLTLILLFGSLTPATQPATAPHPGSAISQLAPFHPFKHFIRMVKHFFGFELNDDGELEPPKP